MAKKKKTGEKKINELEERVKKLEQEKKELERTVKEEKKEEDSTVGSVLGGIIPGLGGLVKGLAKASPEFAKKLEETDKEIAFRMEKGGGINKPHIEYHFSARPLISGKLPERKKEKPETIIIWEEVPAVEKQELKVYTVGKNLLIETKDKKYSKKIPLSYYAEDINWKYKKGKKIGMIMVRIKTK